MVYVLSAKQVHPTTHTLGHGIVNGDTTNKYNGHNNGGVGAGVGADPSGQETEENKQLEDPIARNLIGVAGFGLIMIIYSSLGALTFVKLEAEADKQRILDLRLTVTLARHKFSTAVSQLYHMNGTIDNSSDEIQTALNLEEFNKLLSEYEETLDDVSEGALTMYIAKLGSPKGRWNFFHALLFVFTLVTTIGYGNLTPRTLPGRMFCVMFALLGIPIALIEIALSGKLLAGVFMSIFGKFIKLDRLPSVSEKSSMITKLFGTTLTVMGVLNLLIGYTIIGAFLYNYTEGWGFVNSFYFCFTTLTTVGFGDLVPTSGGNPFAVFRVFYILFGLALTSTSFELIRQQYSNTWSKRRPKRIKTPALYVAVQRARHNHGMLDTLTAANGSIPVIRPTDLKNVDSGSDIPGSWIIH